MSSRSSSSIGAGWSARNSSSSDDDASSSSLSSDTSGSSKRKPSRISRKRQFQYCTTNVIQSNEQQSYSQLKTEPSSRDFQLKIVRQPEEQHRARYLSEGSRGAVKDKSGKSHCSIQLIGYGRPTPLQIYAGMEGDPLTPHPLYRVIAVNGKGCTNLTTPCKEVMTSSGIHAIEVTFRPEHKMTAMLDCIGILKVCSHDMRRKLKNKSSKGARIRLVFRCTIPDPLDSTRDIVLQTFSDAISCVQQLGYPEIKKLSIDSDGPRGGSELIILGRNFAKNAAVIFREYNSAGRLVWTSEAQLEKSFMNTNHLVCSVPTYRHLSINHPVEATVVVQCGNKTSHSHQFLYKSESKKQELSLSLGQEQYQSDWTPEIYNPSEPYRPDSGVRYSTGASSMYYGEFNQQPSLPATSSSAGDLLNSNQGNYH